jgi:hypothetical protein
MRTRLLASMALSALVAITGACGDGEDADTASQTATGTGETHEAATLKADLKGGAEEVPNPGDPDGTGTADVKLDQNKNEVCYDIKVENIAAPAAAHIHKGAKGAAGPVVVTFDPAKIGQGEACVPSDHAVIDEIVGNPAGFYVNVHTADFQGGAVRGQLEKS